MANSFGKNFKVGGPGLGGGPGGVGAAGAGGGGGPPPATGEPGVGVFITGGEGIFEILDSTGLFGPVGILYDIRIIDGVMEVTRASDGQSVEPNQAMLDFLEAEGVIFDTVGTPIGEDVTDGDVVMPGADGGEETTEGDILDGLLPESVLRETKKVEATAKELYEAMLKVSVGVLEPSERYKREGEEALAGIFRRVPYVGPGWDKLRVVLREKLEPLMADISEGIEGADLPDIVEEGLDDATEFIADLVRLEAVPLPFPVPTNFPIPPWFIILLVLLEILWWLARRPQSTSPQPQPLPRPRQADTERDQDQEEGDQGSDYRPQPRVIPIPIPVRDKPSIIPQIKDACVIVEFRPGIRLEACKRRTSWRFHMVIFETNISHDV